MSVPITVVSESVDSFFNGAGIATTTPQKLDPIPYEFLKGVTISNDGASSIFIGPTQTTALFEIGAGEKSQRIPVDSPTAIWIRSGGSVAFSWLGA